MSENGEIYTAGKYFTLPPALTGWTNSTSDNKDSSAPHWLCGFARGRSLRMIICKMSVPPNDHLKEALQIIIWERPTHLNDNFQNISSSRWSLAFVVCHCFSLFIVICCCLLFIFVCLLLFVVVCQLPFVVVCRLSIVVVCCLSLFVVCLCMSFVVVSCLLFFVIVCRLLFVIFAVCHDCYLSLHVVCH